MSSFEGLNKFFGGNLITIAVQLSYSHVNILILKGKEEEVKIDYPEIYQNILSCRYHADKRNVFDYAKDIVASWVFEDYFISKIRGFNLKLDLDGADRNRVILPNNKTSSNSDYLITYKNIQRKMELMSDYKGYWTKYKMLDLRDSKYNKLVATKSIFLGICIPDNYFLFIDFEIPPKAKFIPSHYPYGGKPAYQIKVLNENKTEFSYESIVDRIKKTYPE
jgi:hypothetical protein